MTLICQADKYSVTVHRKMTRFLGLLKGKAPETESDWEELIDDWDNIWAKDRISTDQQR